MRGRASGARQPRPKGAIKGWTARTSRSWVTGPRVTAPGNGGRCECCGRYCDGTNGSRCRRPRLGPLAARRPCARRSAAGERVSTPTNLLAGGEVRRRTAIPWWRARGYRSAVSWWMWWDGACAPGSAVGGRSGWGSGRGPGPAVLPGRGAVCNGFSAGVRGGRCGRGDSGGWDRRGVVVLGSTSPLTSGHGCSARKPPDGTARPCVSADPAAS